jgi:hypothetical protein
MPHPSGPNRDDSPTAAGFHRDALDQDSRADPDEAEADPVEELAADDEVTEAYRTAPSDTDPATEVMDKADRENQQSAKPQPQRGERRFTAPGFDAKETAVIETAREPATEVFRPGQAPTGQQRPPRSAGPQPVPPRLGAALRRSSQRSWGWVLALILVILALASVAVLVTVLLTNGHRKKAASAADQVRATIQSFDVAVQTGDFTVLRAITCDSYANYHEHAHPDTYHRVAAAEQSPVVAKVTVVHPRAERLDRAS